METLGERVLNTLTASTPNSSFPRQLLLLLRCSILDFWNCDCSNSYSNWNIKSTLNIAFTKHRLDLQKISVFCFIYR